MIDTAENTAENISPDMHALACAINALPGEQRAALAPLLNKVLNAAASRRILALVQDALGQLRIGHAISGLRQRSHPPRA